MIGWEASYPPVDNHATIDSPVPSPPWVLDDQRTVTGSPFGSDVMADNATNAPKSERSASYAAVCEDNGVGDTISISGGSFPSGAVIVVVVSGAFVVVVVGAAVVVVVVVSTVEVVDVVVPANVVVVEEEAETPASSALTVMAVVVVSFVVGEHPAARSAAATITILHIRFTPFHPRYYEPTHLQVSQF